MNTVIADWHSKAANCSLDGRALIDGKRVGAVDGKTFDCISPIDAKVLTQVSRCQAADVDVAVKVARAAFNDGRWNTHGALFKLFFSERLRCISKSACCKIRSLNPELESSACASTSRGRNTPS